MQNTLAAAPVRPDFHFCKEGFSWPNQPLRPADCLQAQALMPRGTQLVRYHQPNYDDMQHIHDIEFPLKYVHGTCIITIEDVDPSYDGPNGRPDANAWYDIAPDRFHGMAGWVMRQCVQSMPPLGGFITSTLTNTVDYLRLPTAALLPDTWPLSANFFTVTVTADLDGDGDGHPYPGDYDPTMDFAATIFNSLYEILLNTPFGSPLWPSLSNNMAERINHNWGRMGRANRIASTDIATLGTANEIIEACVNKF